MESWQLEALQQNTIYRLIWLGDGIFRIADNDVFADLLVGENQALLWDTGFGYDDLYALVRRITDLPLYVVNSHGHMDHTNGNWQFDSVFIHPDDMELCSLHNTRQYRRPSPDAILPADFVPEDHLDHDCGWLRPVQEGHVFDLGRKTLEVVHLPGHTHGSIGLWYREERALYVGDAVNNFLWLFLPEATSLSVYRKTLNKVQALDFDWMIQSHEAEILPKSRLNWYIDLIDHLDFDRGRPVPCPVPGQSADDCRICIRSGLTLEDRSREDFAAILIAAEKLD